MSEEDRKDRKREYDKAYRAANREKRAAQQKEYRAANKEWLAVRKREYDKAYRAANKDKIVEYKRAHQKANRAIYLARNNKRRALKKNQIPKYLIGCPLEKDRLTKIYKLRAIISEATGVEHHVDHMWPLSDGGPHWSGNLQIITAEENLSKFASVCEETKKVIQESLEYALQEYKMEKRCT